MRGIFVLLTAFYYIFYIKPIKMISLRFAPISSAVFLTVRKGAFPFAHSRKRRTIVKEDRDNEEQSSHQKGGSKWQIK